MASLRRDEYYAWLEFKPEGVDVVFNEAPSVLPLKQVSDSKELYLIAFHLHREGHEGYAGYPEQLPNSIAFNDPEVEILRKMGQPTERGGGNILPVLKRPVPYWLRYPFGEMRRSPFPIRRERPC